MIGFQGDREKQKPPTVKQLATVKTYQSTMYKDIQTTYIMINKILSNYITPKISIIGVKVRQCILAGSNEMLETISGQWDDDPE